MWVPLTVFPLPPLAPRTSVTGSSRSPLLPTPVAQDGKNATAPSQADRNTPPLTHALLPTPTATPYGNNQSPSEGAAVRPSLESLLADASGSGSTTEDSAPAATPTSMTLEDSTPNRETEATDSPTALLPTPHGFAKEGQRRGPGPSGNELGVALRRATTGADTPERSSGGKKSPVPLLNPSFVAWMQGMPDDWSDPNCPLTATEFTSDPRCSWAVESSNSGAS